MSQPIALAYLSGGVNKQLTTRPGHSIRFNGGEARIYDERDMPAVLRTPGVIVSPVEEKVDWVPQWMQQCGEHKPPVADIRLPGGYSISGAWPDYILERPSPTMTVLASDMAVEAGTTIAPKKRRGRKPKKQAKQTSSPVVEIPSLELEDLNLEGWEAPDV